MSDKSKDDAGVLGSLPATRSTGLRAERTREGAKGRAAKASNGRAKAKPKPKATASAKPRTTASAKRKSTAAAKPRASASAKPKRTAKITTTEPAPRTPATPAPEPAAPHRPQPVRAGAPALAESTQRARSDAPEPLELGAAPPSGTELVTTAVQAAGELAQIGLKLSGRALKRAVGRLPKP
jgi:hypothetical protein